MDPTSCILVGAPVDSGKRRKGCLMGPDAYRTARLAETLADLGHDVVDIGNVVPASAREHDCANPLVHSLPATVAWAEALAGAAQQAAAKGLPIFMGGDHALSLGTVAGMAAHAEAAGRPLFVLWLDAHTDLHTPLDHRLRQSARHAHGLRHRPRRASRPSRRCRRPCRRRMSA